MMRLNVTTNKGRNLEIQCENQSDGLDKLSAMTDSDEYAVSITDEPNCLSCFDENHGCGYCDEVTDDFEKAFENPDDFDFGFTKQREAAGFANFGFDPQKAAEMQQQEVDAILAKQQQENPAE